MLPRIFQAKRRAPGWPPLALLFWWGFVRGLVWIFFKIVYRISMSGHEHVPRIGPIIYVANHQSNYDPCIVGLLTTDRPFSGMARATLFKSKILAWVMRGIGVIKLDQTKGDAGAMKAALSELETGRCVLIYPEGTRTRDGAIHEFKRGVMLLIRRAPAGTNVVPVALEGAFDAWPIGTSKPKLQGRIAVKAAPMITSDELAQQEPDDALERLKRIIEGMRLELRQQLRRETGGRFPARGPGDRPYWEQETSNPSEAVS